MKVLLVVAVVFGAALAAPQARMHFRNLFKKELESVSKQHPSGRIINGQIAQPHSIPYQVLLEVLDESGAGWYCGGSLIAEDVVLTAGHCGYKGKQVIVTLGAHSLLHNENSQVKIISKDIVVHEKFKWSSYLYDYDIALIRLPQPVTLNKYIQTAKLPIAADAAKTYEGEIGRVSGWGVTDAFNSSLADELRYVEDKILSHQECHDIFDIYDYHVCLNGSNGYRSCDGDTGGPLTVDGVQIGVFSYGIYYCLEGYPSVFIRTNSFLDWIAENSSSA